VRRTVVIFMCLVACLSFGRGSIAHACAPDFATFLAGVDRVAHQEVDRRQVGKCGDDHKATAHHHAACHGHKIGTPPAAEALILVDAPVVAFAPVLPALGPDARPDTATRPPNA
jgi:hypothetical protein